MPEMMPEMISDPARRVIDAEFVNALYQRYKGSVPALGFAPDNYAERFANVCDLVVQLLWPETYGVTVTDPVRHTSNEARTIAHLMLAAAGVGHFSEGSVI